MQKRMKIILVVVIAAILVLVTLIWILTMGFGGLVDYWATYDEFDSIEKEGNNKIIFTMPEVWGYPDGKVAFTDCAFSLQINGTSLPPVNVYLENHYDDLGGHYWQTYAQIAKGAGLYNSVAFIQGNVSYIVTFIDSDSDDYVTSGDLVIIDCTEPLIVGMSYELNVCVDIDGTWGIGLVYGTWLN